VSEWSERTSKLSARERVNRAQRGDRVSEWSERTGKLSARERITERSEVIA